jgi:phenylalanyl-tRNA synthetase beta chain
MGRAYSAVEIGGVFERLQLDYRHESQPSDDLFHVVPPAERFDLEIEEDLIEEVARIVGFSQIGLRSPTAMLVPSIPSETTRSAHHLRQALVYQEFNEVVTYSFIEPELASHFSASDRQIRLLNPIAAQHSVMRPALVPSLVGVLRDNLARQESRIRVFEVGRVFLSDASIRDDAQQVAGVHQPLRVSALAYGPALDEQWGTKSRQVDFYDLKADLEAMAAPLVLDFVAIDPRGNEFLPFLHPGVAASIHLEGQRIGWIGAIHPSLQQSWEIPQPVLAFEVDVKPLLRCDMPTLVPPSKFPMVIRDLAFIVPIGLPAGKLLASISSLKESNNQLHNLNNFKCFDEYKGQGIGLNEKSLAFRLYFQDTHRTLEDANIEQAVSLVVQTLEKDCGAALRLA